MRAENSSDTSGTPGYMAPEVMCRLNHTYSVDYFALGVIAYEFMLGKRPYLGRSRKEIRDQILARQVQIKGAEIPDQWSLESIDFVNKVFYCYEFLAALTKAIKSFRVQWRLGTQGSSLA